MVSWLFPLYFAALGALALPILLHRIRRTPSGRRPFSTLMFLVPSLPRLTRRSRLEHLLLLFLRGLALCLLAAAFARPFFRQSDQTAVPPAQGRSVVLAIDTSASMRRAELWQEARQRVDELLAEASENDRVAVVLFAEQPAVLLRFDEWSSTVTGRALVRERLNQTVPGWRGTDFGTALVAAAQLAVEASAGRMAGAAQNQIVLVSDLQQGGRLDALQGYDWPADVALRLVRLDASPTNAAPQWLASSVVPDDSAGWRPRVRITNAANSQREQFRLSWAGAGETSETIDVYVPPGEVRTLAAPSLHRAPQDGSSLPSARENVGESEGGGPGAPRNPTLLHKGGGSDAAAAASASVPSARESVGESEGGGPGAPRTPTLLHKGGGSDAAARDGEERRSRLVLSGDDHNFDNALYVCPPTPRRLRVLYVGRADADDPRAPLYYLKRAFPETPFRSVAVDRCPSSGPLPDDPPAQLLAVAEPLAEPAARQVRGLVERGAKALFLLTSSDLAPSLALVLGVERVQVESADVKDYAMLGAIDFTHPLFAPFADARFADFTKIHFWRRLRLGIAEVPDARVLARFEDGDPALVELALGRGWIYVLASGWQPEQSELARSSKFVPLLNGILEFGMAQTSAQFEVGAAVPLPSRNSAPVTVVMPDGSQKTMPAEAREFAETDVPGVYTLRGAGIEAELRFAVNLAAGESNTAPLASEAFEQLGVLLDRETARPHKERAATERQMLAAELENRQKLWQWLIAAAVCVLLGETWLAGLLARRHS